LPAELHALLSYEKVGLNRAHFIVFAIAPPTATLILVAAEMSFPRLPMRSRTMGISPFVVVFFACVVVVVSALSQNF
jgi:hypothetical protein